MKQWILTLITIAGLMLSQDSFSQSVYYVKPGGSGNGSTWANASGDLQAMIDMANPDDQVWVAAGTYKPISLSGATGTTTDRDVSFVLKSGVKVYGGFSGTESQLDQRNPAANITVLSGDIGASGNHSDNAHHVVLSIKTDAQTLLDGFTIIHGTADGVGSVSVNGINVIRYSGGGIYANQSNTVFRNVRVLNNKSLGGDDYYGNGGGIFASNSELTIEDSEVSENAAERVPDKAGGTSGAIYIAGSANIRAKLNLTRVKIEKNTAMNLGGAIYISGFTDSELTDVDFVENKTTNGSGGAIRIDGSSETNFNNFKMDGGSFVKNSATAAGGAVYVWSFTNYHFNNIVFSENVNNSAGAAMFLFSGGGTAAPNDEAVITNSVFYKNEARGATLGGGAIFISNGTQATMVNNTFYDNYAKFNGGALGVFSNAVVKADIFNNIFYGNRSDGADQDFYVGPLSTLNLSHSITQGQGIDGVNGVKINVDPQFSSIDPQNPHFLRLLEASPAVNAGDNDKIPGGITKDLAGNDRIIDGTVDMGAYEFKDDGGPTLTQTITFDLDITKTYGDPEFEPNATASSGLPVSYSSSNSDVAVAEDGKLVVKGAGTAQITATQPGNFEYLPAEDITRTLTVTKTTLTIKAADTTMLQGDPLPQFRLIYSGLVYDETSEVLTIQPVVTTSANSSSPAGEYTLTVSGAEADNYNIVYETGKLTIVTEHAEGKIRYVKPTATGTGTGLSWDNASSDLQAMIDASSEGGEVWVAKGTYKPTNLPGGSGGGRDVAFVLKSGVGIYGGFAGNEVRRSDRDVTANETVLSGDVGVSGTNTDNAYHVVLSVKNTAGTILDGFTITDGLSGGTGNYSVDGVTIDKSSGAGIYVIQSQNILFENLKITGNNIVTSGVGGGLYVKNSKLTVKNSVISENATAGSSGQGAGFYLLGESGAINETKFIGVTIRNNSSIRTGGAGYIGSYNITEFENSDIEDNTGSEGAGIHIGSGQAGFQNKITATRSNFRRNIGLATGNGGAMLVAQYNELELYDCEFADNVAGYQGGAIYINGNQTLFTRFIVDGCTFSGNKLLQELGNGGALRINFYIDAWIKNSVFYDNESAGGGAISFTGSSNAPAKNYYVINSVFYNNKSTGSTSGGGAISTSNYMTGNVINSTFYNNEAANEGGAIRIMQSRTLAFNVYNSIFHQNKALIANDVTMPDWPEIDFKNNYTQEAGENGVDGVIIGSNPAFVSTDPANPEFLHLSVMSDAINKGDNSFVPADITKDLAGNDRIVYNVVDMGAYEYNGPPLNPTETQTITFAGDISKTYGDAMFDPGATASSELQVIYTSSNTAVAVVTSDNNIRLIGAGTTEITATQPGNALYLPADPVTVTLTVTKAPLVIRPNDVGVEQGKEFPQFTASYTGLVYDDTEASIATPPLISTTATPDSPLGTYPLTASGAESNKYDITYQEGTLTITEPVWEPAEKVKWEVWFSSATELQVEVDMVSAQTATLLLYTSAGVPVYHQQVNLHPGTNKLTIPTSRMVSGVYIVNLRGNGLKLEKKIIKR